MLRTLPDLGRHIRENVLDGGLADGAEVAHAFVSAEAPDGFLAGIERRRALSKLAEHLRPSRMMLYAKNGCPNGREACSLRVGGGVGRDTGVCTGGDGGRPSRGTERCFMVEVRSTAPAGKGGARPHLSGLSLQCGIKTHATHLYAAAWAKAWACYGMVTDAERGVFGVSPEEDGDDIIGETMREREDGVQAENVTRVALATAAAHAGNGSVADRSVATFLARRPSKMERGRRRYESSPTASSAASPPEIRPYSHVVYMRSDLWFALPPPAIDTFSNQHVSVPFCNPLPAHTRCTSTAGSRSGFGPRSRRYRSMPGYADALGRGGDSGCDVPTDWLGVMPRHLAEAYFSAQESIGAHPSARLCQAHRSGCYCHDTNMLHAECLLGGHLASKAVEYMRRDFGLLALARQVLSAPSASGGDGVFTDVAVMGNGINVKDCEQGADVAKRGRVAPACPRFCARDVYAGRQSFKGALLTLACFPGERPLPTGKHVDPFPRMLPLPTSSSMPGGPAAQAAAAKVVPTRRLPTTQLTTKLQQIRQARLQQHQQKLQQLRLSARANAGPNGNHPQAGAQAAHKKKQLKLLKKAAKAAKVASRSSTDQGSEAAPAPKTSGVVLRRYATSASAGASEP